MSSKASSATLQKIHAAMHRLGVLEHKAEMVKGYSAEGHESSRDLTEAEALQLLADLNRNQAKTARQDDERQKMIRHLFAMAHEMGWIRTVTHVEGGQLKPRKDYTDLHKWVEKYGYLKKHLNRYSYQELPKLVTQFKSLYMDWLNKKR